MTLIDEYAGAGIDGAMMYEDENGFVIEYWFTDDEGRQNVWECYEDKEDCLEAYKAIVAVMAMEDDNG